MLQMKIDELESLRIVLKYLEAEHKHFAPFPGNPNDAPNVWLHVDHLQSYLDYENDLANTTKKEKS